MKFGIGLMPGMLGKVERNIPPHDLNFEWRISSVMDETISQLSCLFSHFLASLSVSLSFPGMYVFVRSGYEVRRHKRHNERRLVSARGRRRDLAERAPAYDDRGDRRTPCEV